MRQAAGNSRLSQHLLGLSFLNKSDPSAEHNHAQNDAGIDPVTKKASDHCVSQHCGDQYMMDLGQEAQDMRPPLQDRQRIVVVLRRTALRFSLGKAELVGA